MRMTAEQKQAARHSIVEAAGRLFRRDGYVGVGVDAIARAIRQTAGAVYSHFGGKHEVFADVVEAGLARLAKGAERARNTGSADWVLAFAGQYLSAAHRTAIADGCLLPALTADVARADRELRCLFERNARGVAVQIAEGCRNGGTDGAPTCGWAILALCAGGIMLSRAAADDAVANEILASCREAAGRIVSTDGPMG